MPAVCFRYYNTTNLLKNQGLYRFLDGIILGSMAVTDGRLRKGRFNNIQTGGRHMGVENWMELMDGQMWLEQVRETNQYTEKYGLTLSAEDAEILLAEKDRILKAERRVEFGQSILPQIIYTFCDSSYISQDDYVDTLSRLQEIFYLYKNEMQDEITDEELLAFMKEQFETVCFGDLQYLEGTCLDIFAQAIRAGYRGYSETQGRKEFARFDIVQRWDKELYLLALSQSN